MTNKSLSAESLLSSLNIQIDTTTDWLRELREEGLASITATGLPSKKVEEWKYISLDKIAKTPFKAAKPSTLSQEDIAKFSIADATELVFVDGFFSAELSDLNDLADGLTVKNLQTALVEDPEILRVYLDQPCAEAVDAFTKLNKALIGQGTFIKVERKAIIEKPIHILYVSTQNETLVAPRNVIVAEALSEVEVLEDYVSLSEDIVALTNSVSQVYVAENAVVRHTKNQAQNLSSFHVGTTRAYAEKNSQYKSLCFSSGSALNRNNLDVELISENAQVEMNGLYVTKESQVCDNHTVINHVIGHTESRQLYKGILDGRSRAVFNGKIHIVKDAQLSDSGLLNKNMLLGKGARVDTKPELEVYADDVKANHGATVGQLDQNQLFYCQSRNIAKEDARNMLIHGFMDEVLDSVHNESFRAYIHTFFDSFFDYRGV